MLKRWLKNLPTAPDLPDPNKETDSKKQEICLASNLAILEATGGDDPLAMESSPRGQKRKRGQYKHYTPEERLKIGKYGSLHGTAAAVRHFNQVLGWKINESSVHDMVKDYKNKLAEVPAEEEIQ